MKLTRVVPVLLAASAVAVAGAVPGQAQEGSFPEGWQLRFDRDGSSMDDVEMVIMSPGMHITTGPAMIAYHPDSLATGDFRIESETFLFDPGGRREAFGFFVGGSDLQGPNQRYTYFLVREGGEFLVKTRSGTETGLVHDWTAHAAIACPTLPSRQMPAPRRTSWSWRRRATSCASRSTASRSGADRVRRVETEGVFGLRINHGLDICM